MGEKDSSGPEDTPSMLPTQEVHRLALNQGGNSSDCNNASPPQLENEDGKDDRGFDLSILLKPQKNPTSNNSRSNPNANFLGASFASELSVLTEDGGEESRSVNDLSWVGSEEGTENDDQDETMELLDKAIADLREMSLEDQSELDLSAIDDAIRNIQSALKEDDEGSEKLEDMESIRNRLVYEQDTRSGAVRDDDASMIWETTLCRLRGGTALSLYSLLASKFQDTSDFIRFGTKFAGVAVLCFLAGVPRRDEMEATSTGFQIRLLFLSRKTVLLLVYVVAWISIFDASMEAWEGSWLGSLDRTLFERSVDETESFHSPISNTRSGEIKFFPEQTFERPDFPYLDLEEDSRPKDTAEHGEQTGTDYQGRQPKGGWNGISNRPIIERSVNHGTKSLPNPIPLEPSGLDDQDARPKGIEEQDEATNDIQGTDFETDELDRSVLGSSAVKMPPIPAGDVRKVRGAYHRKIQGAELAIAKESLPVPKSLSSRIRNPEVSMRSKKSLRGESAQIAATARDDDLSSGEGKSFLRHLRKLIREALRHGLLFMVGSPGGHRSQHMLDILHEIWFQRRWQ